MENTTDNKKLFFSMYFRQRVRKIQKTDKSFDSEIFPNYDLHRVEGDYLELTPLSMITDEHAIELQKIKGANHPIKFPLGYLGDCGSHIKCIDYLRSKGYALPFMEVSVEQMIEWNWIKLKAKL